jgi:hypothetical protein
MLCSSSFHVACVVGHFSTSYATYEDLLHTYELFSAHAYFNVATNFDDLYNTWLGHM